MTKGSTTVGLRAKSALVVDDNLQTQKLLGTVIGGAGFEVVKVSTLEEAITASDRRAFDVAFVDKNLVEFDDNNRDGLAVLRHIHKKGEGTELVYLTSRTASAFFDVAELGEDIGALRSLVKGATLSESVRKVLDQVRDSRQTSQGFKNGSSIRVFSGHDGPGEWDAHAFKSLLKPTVGLLGLMNLLDEIAGTCAPLLERPGDNGLQPTDVAGVMAGLYWSRGVGEAVVIVLAKGEIPSDVPRLDTWPGGLRMGETLFQWKRKNLVGAVIKCGGVEHTEFTVPRSPGE